jgi:hypothetical protein
MDLRPSESRQQQTEREAEAVGGSAALRGGKHLVQNKAIELIVLVVRQQITRVGIRRSAAD